ncbi:Putative carboxypeptidase [Ignavibacterium album JCM 16511]|uniref:Putative carboxypeptidase n=1 Tax=Ignavibacterium album (strain DSM 19864 / JCM 16511 / NBRC 101810 / Mat9-16) TaxID=945713 RepID=I0ANP8_IGNAJ|nr:M14 family zinc carboxypeptidase [Ignavibacterium album]AFH50605.1 Putative carboxypeptidase [Ignavibacterium album JCM 16511]
MKKIFVVILLTFNFIIAQQTPLEKSNFTKLTSHDELKQFIQEVDKNSDLIKSEVLTKSIESRELFAVYFSKNEFGADKNKLKVLIFAQQHGNEQSGKEASLLLINELLKPDNQYLFDKIDFLLVPQMNPDGSEKNQRRNGNGMDLNRNHLILTEPETIALHKLFDKYLFEVTMDVHEYWPFGEEWKKLGFRRNFDVTVGAITNINISEKIKKLSYEKYLPFVFDFVKEKGYTAFHYLPGGPIGADYIRYSTFDINDGRQSFGIQNTFSFIQEGMNGENYSTDNLERRAKSQMAGMLTLLKFSYDHKDEIKKLIAEEREKLINNNVGDKVAIQLDHFSDGTELKFNLFSYYSGKDTLVKVNDFRSVVKSLYDVERPKGYLIPKELIELKQWMDKHNLIYEEAELDRCDKIEEYFIDSVGTIDFERDTIINPYISLREVKDKIDLEKYYFLPVNQLKNNMIVIALEPKSMLGLVTYKQFEYLLKPKEKYKILRVIN